MLSAALANLNSSAGTEGAASQVLNFTSTANFTTPGVSTGVLVVLGQIAAPSPATWSPRSTWWRWLTPRW